MNSGSAGHAGSSAPRAAARARTARASSSSACMAGKDFSRPSLGRGVPVAARTSHAGATGVSAVRASLAATTPMGLRRFPTALGPSLLREHPLSLVAVFLRFDLGVSQLREEARHLRLHLLLGHPVRNGDALLAVDRHAALICHRCPPVSTPAAPHRRLR